MPQTNRRTSRIPRIAPLLGWLVVCALASSVVLSQSEPANTAPTEVCRIRIGNRPDGLVQVSTDAGRTYSTVGRVKVAANSRITGFAAASYTPRGAVAASATHGIRIKTGQAALGIGKAQQPLMFSITPAEFGVIPKRYGGHQPRSAQILTDIPAGRSIFRNQAPRVGSAVHIEDQESLRELPEDYLPTGGETFVILVRQPRDTPRDIVFENRVGGKVTANWPDGGSEILTTVLRPVVGVGRYDGTTFTGTGAINTNHGGVITIGTAPVCPPGTKEGGVVETRGGFMIQPSYHAREQRETSPQVMVIGPANSPGPLLEGKPPLFLEHISLSSYPAHARGSCRVEVRVGDGDWQPPPAAVGKADRALAKVSEIRISTAEHDPKLMEQDVSAEAARYTRSLPARGFSPLSGTALLQPRRSAESASVVYFSIDGTVEKVSNRRPYTYLWDTTRVANGLHEVVIRTVLSSGESVSEWRSVLVRN